MMPANLSPEVREALNYAKKCGEVLNQQDFKTLADPVAVRHAMTLATFIESLHAGEGLPEGCAQSLGDTIDQALAEHDHIGCLGPQTLGHLRSWRSRLSSTPPSPREWDVESIKDAPEGLYFIETFGAGRYEEIPVSVGRETLKMWANSVRFVRAFGPIPQPPTTPQHGVSE